MWLPNSTTDPQRGLKICSNHAFPCCTSKILHRALSNERDVVKNIDHGFGRKSMDIVVAPWLCNPLEAAQWPCLKTLLFICDFPIVLQIPNMDWKYVPMMHSLSEHRKCYKRRSLMKEIWSKNTSWFWSEKYGYSCGSLALQSPGSSSVVLFKNILIHMWLPKSTTDPQHGLKICSNDAFPFWTSKMLQKALSNERDVVKKNDHGFGRKKYGYSCGPLALQSPGGSSVAMFKNTPIHDLSIVLQIPNMDWTYVQTMHSLSVHPKSYTGRSLMIEMRSMVGRSMDIVVASYSLALQSPGGSSVAMFKNPPFHMRLPNSTTDPQRGLKICSNDAFPFWTPKMLQKALSDERDLVKKYIMVLVGKVWI